MLFRSLPRLIGAARATDVLLTGRVVAGPEAAQIGLLSRIADAGQADDVAAQVVGQLLQADPLALRLTKEALNCGCGSGSLEAAIALENRNQSLCFASASARAGVEAFRSRRGRSVARDSAKTRPARPVRLGAGSVS